MALDPPQVMAFLFNLLHSGSTFGRILPDLCFLLLLLSLCFFFSADELRILRTEVKKFLHTSQQWQINYKKKQTLTHK